MLIKVTHYHSAFDSDSFVFVVGKEKQEFTVHSSVFARLGACFERLIGGAGRGGGPNAASIGTASLLRCSGASASSPTVVTTTA